MPRLPDIDSLGSRPVPRSQRRISSVRNAGAVADAAGGLGDKIAGIGNKIIEKEDRLSYAAAKSAYLKADVQARQELENDPEYGAHESRYQEKMKAAEEAASGFIKSKSDRAMFTADIGVDFERGRGQVLKGVHAKKITAKKAVLFEGLETLSDVGRDALDEETRATTIQNASEMIDAAAAEGLINQVERFAMKERWSSDYAIEQVRLMKARGDVRGAEAYLKKMRPIIQGEAGLRLEESLTKDIGELDMSDFVDGIMGVATNSEEGTDVPYGDPLRGRGTGIKAGGKFGVKRGSKTHNGVDMTGKRGSPIYSGYGAGTATVGYDKKSGHYVKIDHGNGLVSSYSHMDKPAVQSGDIITPDTIIGDIGMSGNTSGPHVHVVVKKDGKTVDPESVIGSARQSARRHDLDQLLAQVDIAADEAGWDSLKREQYKTEVARRVSRDETLASRDEAEADRSASEVVLELGGDFKSISQIPSQILDKMDPRDVARYERAATRNNKPAKIEANGVTAIQLDMMEILEPEKFASLNLGQYVGEVTKGELAGFLAKQARIAKKATEEVDIRPKITSTINVLSTKEMNLKGKGNEQNFINTVRTMEGILAGNPKPTRSELDEAFKMATREIQIYGTLYGTNDKPLYELEIDNIPANSRDRIIASAKRNLGREPTEEEIIQAYQIQRARR